MGYIGIDEFSIVVCSEHGWSDVIVAWMASQGFLACCIGCTPQDDQRRWWKLEVDEVAQPN